MSANEVVVHSERWGLFLIYQVGCPHHAGYSDYINGNTVTDGRRWGWRYHRGKGEMKNAHDLRLVRSPYIGEVDKGAIASSGQLVLLVR